MLEVSQVRLDTIIVPSDRQRKESADSHIVELAASIEANGLLHAIVVTEDSVLVSGWCRLAAIKLLASKELSFYYNSQSIQPGWLPIVRTHKSTPTDLYQIELEENLRRKNLSIIEQAQAIAQLHKLKQTVSPAWTKKETAAAVAALRNRPQAASDEKEVADSILLDNFADDPDVRKATSKAKAVRLATRKLEQQALAALGVTAEINTSRHQIIAGDSLSLLPTLEKSEFDCIITDPPYGIGADAFGSAGFLKQKHSYTDSPEHALASYRAVAEHGYWLCHDEAHLFAFCDIRQFPLLVPLFELYNWSVWPTPLIWFKGTTAHAPRPEYGPKRAYEAILFASKGDKKTMKLGLDLLTEVSGVSSSRKLHPAEKPPELYRELLSWSVVPGMKVLDPFAGSGPVFRAADELGCDAVGIEQDELFVNICRQRIEEINQI